VAAGRDRLFDEPWAIRPAVHLLLRD